MGEPGGQPDQSAPAGETTQSDARDGSRQHQQPDEAQSRPRGRGEEIVSWFTETFLRAAIAVVGLVLLLVALGQIAGVDTFSIIGSILGSNIAQWGAVALFGLLLILAASKRWRFVGQ